MPPGRRAGGGGYTSNGQYGEVPPERLQVYKMVGISLVDVYERIGKSVILVFHKAQKGLRDTNYGCEVEETFWFCDLFIF